MRKLESNAILYLLIATVFLMASVVDIAKSEVETIISTNALSEKWNKTFGGRGWDSGLSVQQTSDGGYIIIGDTFSFGRGGADLWLIKTDSNGNKLWDKTFGGSSTDAGRFVQQASDGGYIIIGDTHSFGSGGYDVWLIKTDGDGNEEWNKTFGGTNDEYGSSVQQTNDGGYIIGGDTDYVIGETHDILLVGNDAWLIKTDGDGNEEWNKTFIGYGLWGFPSVMQTSDSGFIITGQRGSYYTKNHGGLCLLKADSSGNEMWNKTFGENSSWGHSVQQASDGGYIVAGERMTHGEGAVSYDIYLIKADVNGNEEWNKTFGENSSHGYSVQQTSDDGYIIVGNTDSFGTGHYEGYDVWLIKIDANGNEEWNKTFGGTKYDVGYAVQQTADKGYIVIGGTESFGAGSMDAWLIKVNGEEKEGRGIVGFEMIFVVLGIVSVLVLKKKTKRYKC